MIHSETVSFECPNKCNPDYVGVHIRVQGYSRMDIEAEFDFKECDCELSKEAIERLEQRAIDRALTP